MRARNVLRLAAATVAVLALAGPALAADGPVERMKATFAAWVAKHHYADASLAIIRDGKIADTAGFGGYTASSPARVASLSKAITAVCTVKLIEAGKLAFDTPLGDILKGFFARHPAGGDKARAITVGALLNQTSGIAYDATQGLPLLDYKPFSKFSMEAELAAALLKPLGGGRFFYNNINYAALGLVIEAASGESYEPYCKRTVLDPVGASGAAIDPGWRVLGPFGGWRISAVEYAKFLAYFDPGSGLLSIRPKQWPKANLGGGALYGIGVFMRKSGNGYNFWHAGAYNWSGGGYKASFGAYFARWTSGLGFVSAFQPRASDDAVAELDRAMYEAAHP